MVGITHRATEVVPWAHFLLLTASFLLMVTIMGMCVCRKWRWWIYRHKVDPTDDEEGYHSDSMNDENVDPNYTFSQSYIQPALKKISTVFQPSIAPSFGLCDIHIEDIQPAYEDKLAYERIRSGLLTLPKHIPEAPTDLSKDLGLITFSINYDVFTKVLKVLIDRAEGLPKMDTFGMCDPYVKVSLIPKEKTKMETRVNRGNLSPLWNELFTFEDFPHEKLMEKTLFLQVFDYDRFSRDDVIGEVILPLRNIPMPNQRVEFVKELSPSIHSSGWRGDILLSLCYKTSDSHLTVIVMKGRKLKRMDVTGKSDPYAKVTLMSCGRRVAKKRTTLKLKCLDPVWNEAMVFEIVFSEIRDIELLVTVMDYNHYLPNKTIGHVVIGSRSTGTGIKHWTAMMSSSKKAIAMWHRVIK